jgi:hypothetical protein
LFPDKFFPADRENFFPQISQVFAEFFFGLCARRSACVDLREKLQSVFPVDFVRTHALKLQC